MSVRNAFAALRTLPTLLADPARAAQETRRPPAAAALVAAVSVTVFAAAFQFLFPRLQDEIPVLGGLRKTAHSLFGRGHPVFDGDLFARGLLAATLCIACWYVLNLLGALAFDRAGRRSLRALGAAAVTAAPLLVTSLLAVPLYYIHYAAGLAPVFGLLAGAFVHHHAQVGCFGVPRPLAIWLSPVAWLAQVYILYAVLAP